METFQIKTWRIEHLDGITAGEIDWLSTQANNVAYQSAEYLIVQTYSSRPNRLMTKRAMLKFTTVNNKQETLLILKYGDKMILESCVNCRSASIAR